MQTNNANPPKKGKKKGCIIAILVVVGLAIIGSLLPDPKESPSGSSSTVATTSSTTKKIVADTEAIKQLAPKFREEKDEFSGITWVEPKTATKYNNQNDIYGYFALRNGKPENFRLRIQYAAEDWLFIKSYIFLIDGQSYTYTPKKVERDNNSTIWEWSDEEVGSSPELLTIMAAALDAKEIKVRFQGRQYHKDKTLTKKQINQIVDAARYYDAMTPRER